MTRRKRMLAGVVELRQDVPRKMASRKSYRRSRHYRKTRYRAPRFLNRAKPKGWLPPTIR